MPDEIVAICKRFGATYAKKHKEWVASILRYKEFAVEIFNFCQARKIIVDLIP